MDNPSVRFGKSTATPEDYARKFGAYGRFASLPICYVPGLCAAGSHAAVSLSTVMPLSCVLRCAAYGPRSIWGHGQVCAPTARKRYDT